MPTQGSERGDQPGRTNDLTGETAETQFPKVAVSDSMAKSKRPVVLLLLFAYGLHIFSQHRKTENQAWDEIKVLKGQLVEAVGAREEVSKAQNKLSKLLKEVADFRKQLEHDQQLLDESHVTITGMESNTLARVVKQIELCPAEIKGSLTDLQAAVVLPENQSEALSFEKQYMPLMWNAIAQLRTRIQNTSPQDMKDLKHEVDTLHQLLRHATSNIRKVETSEFSDRQARVTELQEEINRLEKDQATNPTSSFIALSEQLLKEEDLQETHKHTKKKKGKSSLPPSALPPKGSASLTSTLELIVAVQPLKCMES